MLLDYRIRVSCETVNKLITGKAKLGLGSNRLRYSLPEGRIMSVDAILPLSIDEGEKIFMNGYQTWTYCPEFGKEDMIPACHMPKAIIDYYGIDRYGDYHFVDYPEKPGMLHGFSYCYFRNGDKFRLFASLDEKPGYTIFRYDANTQYLTISRDCAGLLCGGRFSAFDLFYAEGSEDEVFDAWFRELGIKPRTTEQLAGYSSWYNRYQKIDEKSILSDLTGCAKVLRQGDLFQIDDGWQPYVGDWLGTDQKKFPNGLKPIVEDIHGRGMKAGLWLAPFVCQKGSEVYKNHPDWLLKVDGKPWYCGCNWGGFYSLDIDNPEVVEYLERCFKQIFNDWGFDLVKLDFLYAGAPFGSETESRAGRMIRGMELLRRLCGDKLILGCGVPVMPAFGLVDYCRISCDVSLDWDNVWYMRHTNREHVSTRQAIGNSIFRRQLNGRAYLSDPDVFFLRDYNIKLSQEEKYKLAIVNSLFSGIFLCSDDMSTYSNASLDMYEQLLKNRHATDIVVDNSKGLSVAYTVEGVRYTLDIE